MRVRLPAGLRPRGRVRVPGDKSIGHRALILGAVASGETRLSNLPDGADVVSTRDCVAALGIDMVVLGNEVRLTGRGFDQISRPADALDCGNSGTTMRLLAGLLAGQRFDAVLDGDNSLRRRPMDRIAEPLRQMGARVGTTEGAPPLRIEGASLRGIEYRTPVASAQIKSAILLAGLQAEGPTTVREDALSRDHTERLLGAAGVEVTGVADVDGVTVRPGAELEPLRGAVPGDISSAAYWMVAVAVSGSGSVRLDDVGLNPTRTAVVRVLEAWGLPVRVTRAEDWCGEPTGSIEVDAPGQRLSGGSLAGDDVVGLIDEIPLLAMLGASTEEGLTVRDASELRHKESDRIASTVAAIRALGGQAEECADGLVVPGGQDLRGGVVEAQEDHRIALAAAAIACGVRDEVAIDGAEAAEISYPGFVGQLQALGGAA
ncbi:MAG: 3-phosphoshikimate 1-carboxyvinyltransferase [Acidobacteria bacterium]|nr:3-phosphoshikimate 1-carboxyvinyltransferase [Acidobacteriota bacterium]